MTKPSLTMRRRFNATPQRVFEAWTDPKLLARWMGPGPTQVQSAVSDPRIGGRYDIRMTEPNGTEHGVGGVYREVAPPHKLVFTWAWVSTPERESLVTVTLQADGTGTVMTLHHEHFYDEQVRDRHQHGWDGSLDKLEKLFI